jgi:group II intron reverse transcriptase/maturase
MAKGDRRLDNQEGQVRVMRNAETVLAVIRERGRRGLPLDEVYRQLSNPDLYLTAYGRIYANKGAMTPGVDGVTADGMSLEQIQTIIAAVRSERYRWSPMKRVYIEKKHSTKKRPLGMPTWSDKVLQEVIRMILEAYYEPQFSDLSHGFRPGRGCHTALTTVYRTWRATKWFIEGDISAYFDSIDHDVLLSILREKIIDNRFLRLIENLLKAGYMEDWKLNATLSGTPQGGIVSPILANIYLDLLDKHVETVLIPAFTRGAKRREYPAYKQTRRKLRYASHMGRTASIPALKRQLRTMPSLDPYDPDYRRLRYIRYADDFLLGFAGPRYEAEEIKRKISDFLRDHLKLELSDHKTLITHAVTGRARFLGYEISAARNQTRYTKGNRSVNGTIQLLVPRSVLQEKASRYMQHGKPIHRREWTADTAFSIIAQYQTAYRGIVEYYRMATNLRELNTLKWVMEQSLTKTLANKFRTSVTTVYRRFKTTQWVNGRKTYVLRVTVPREGARPLVTEWGGIPLTRRIDAVLNDTPRREWNVVRSEVVQRLLAQTCELCGSTDRIQVHHVRALRTLQKPGRRPVPEWMAKMAARQRKTLMVCEPCHLRDIHGGEHASHAHYRKRTRVSGEPDAVKVARPVRRGVTGKVPVTAVTP